MADVFLSYAREDRARAEQVARGLELAGVEVFWDNEIPPGTTWADYIEEKLTLAKALIVLWSETSAKSQWVREEARMGRDKGVLIPAMIDRAQAPFGFGEVQAANLADWQGGADDPNWKRFVDAVKRATQSTPRAQPQQQPHVQPAVSAAPPPHQAWSTPPQEQAKKGMPGWAWAAIAVVATIVVLAIVGATMPNQQSAQQGAKPVDTTQPVQQAQQQPQQQPQMDPASQQVLMQQLQQAEQIAAQQGFQQVGQPFTGGLIQSQSWNVPASLVVGYEYRVIGICDQNCRDLDLAVYDQSGATIAQDNATDDHPVVAVVPAATGQFTIQAQMFQCTGQPCYYALVLYGRQRQ